MQANAFAAIPQVADSPANVALIRGIGHELVETFYSQVEQHIRDDIANIVNEVEQIGQFTLSDLISSYFTEEVQLKDISPFFYSQLLESDYKKYIKLN